MSIEVFISLGIYFAAMLLIGWYSYRKTSNLNDYMLGGRDLGPAVTALSAGASDMSSWMLMGLPGAMYVTGLSSGWLAVGLTIGAYVNYVLVAPRLRTFTEVANDAITIPDFFENRFNDTTRVLRLASALVIMVFFTLYTSAGMVSGGRMFETAFGLDYRIGLFSTALVVIAYTLFGGFLAVSLTDFVQGLIMFIALVLVPIVAFTQLGGVTPTFNMIEEVNPSLLDFFKGTTVISIISFIAWGLGYFGQPHIIVRFMAISSVKELKPARRIGMGWMIVSVAGALLTGLIGVAYVHQTGISLKDPETIFIVFSNILFHPLITGFLLSALLAAIMSTVSSQLLVTSSAMTEDLYRTFFRRGATDKELVLVGRLSVLLVAVIALLLSLSPNDTILKLVGYAWAGFGSAFGPAILLSLYWKRMNQWGALAGIMTGAVTVLIWIMTGLDQTTGIYEMIPGFFLSLAAVVAVSFMTHQPAEKAAEMFEEMEEKHRSAS
ncbi:sodium/proline symporter PutP [Bacillus glycinifermentans]|uniref:Sodium/proline symporter n=1 Tax=Bacillus glycinifermentans TaxID=1664069 RepID=A0A0T6BQ61_9BACI|nr:sodium/proline symporter PutP [Bacillus glycinifermentans]ATH94634.1 sodium/proline symporter PutP [Bacillus glycinifermentans]KRT93626.1 proline:sodium symporter PutP [Bacillus glycinifermentans]MEC0486074.1 sodium/proline symporter PutP [Bacillus glycinifermentans]